MIRKEKLQQLKEFIEELKVVEAVERTVLQKDRFIQSEAYFMKLNNGVVIPRERLVKGNKDGSACIIMPVLKNKEVLVVVEPRVFTKSTVGVGFPAGYIENHERVVDAAKRELREETGFVPETLIEMDSFYQDEGCSAAFNHIFLALDCEKKERQQLDLDEQVRYMTFEYEELFELEKMGYIMGSNSKLALEKSKKYWKGKSK